MHSGPRPANGASHQTCRKGGITIDQPFNYEGWPIGYVIMRVQIDGISRYDKDQVTLIAHSSTEFAHKVPHYIGDAHYRSSNCYPQRK